jgi:hypothetical protein
MQISAPRLEQGPNCVRISVRVSSTAFGERLLWYEIPAPWADAVAADRLDAFVVALIPFAFARGEQIVARGNISERLFHGIEHVILPVMRTMFDPGAKTRVEADGFATRCFTSASGVATGFSAGVDSFATICDHFVNERCPSYRVTHLLFNNVGSHGFQDLEAAARLFELRYHRVKTFADEVGLPMLRINSNAHAFIPWSFRQTHPLMNASVALLLQPLFGKLFYSMSYKFADNVAAELSKDISAAEAVLLPALSTDSLQCIAAGGRYTRIEKTRLISNYPPAFDWLNVCVDAEGDGRNCSVCLKCCRTLLTLELLGESHKFSRVFDLAKFAAAREQFIRDHVIHAVPPALEAEILALARELKQPWAMPA